MCVFGEDGVEFPTFPLTYVVVLKTLLCMSARDIAAVMCAYVYVT